MSSFNELNEDIFLYKIITPKIIEVIILYRYYFTMWIGMPRATSAASIVISPNVG